MKINILKYSSCFIFALLTSYVNASEVLPLNPFCQKNIKVVNLLLNNKILKTEIACSEKEKEYGLMNRKNLIVDTGMLFIFDKNQILSFWMKNTLIDLSIAYIDNDWNIIDIREMKANDLTPITSIKPAIFALEANPYWFYRNNIKIGDKIKMIR